MKNILLISFTMFMFSCKSIVTYNNIPGEFCSKGKSYSSNLILNKDSSFFYNIRSHGYSPNCKGKWHLLSKDTILLFCNEEKDILKALSSGYMVKREKKIVIINRNKLKDGQIILRRIR